MRSRVRTFVLIVAVFILGMFGGFIGLFYYLHYAQVRVLDSVLADFPEIDKIWLITNDDVELEIEGVFFTLDGQPDLIYEAGGTDYVSKSEFRKGLARISHSASGFGVARGDSPRA